MDGFRIPLGDWVDVAVDWLRDNVSWLFDFISMVVSTITEGLADALNFLPAPVMILIFALIAWALRSWQLALGTAVTFTVILAVDQWDHAMETLALVLIATIITVLISVPLGIWAARSNTVSAIMKPVLDLMQTMPSMVYLIPAMVFFGLGFVPGVVATIIFSLPPGVRLTELGIRGVDAETVEAGFAFGATPGQILRGVQLPLAMPTILAGINQVIMLALSMAVIAGMAGANGLGKEVAVALNTIDIPRGVEAGLGVVFIAVFLDRVTAALGNPQGFRTSLLSLVSRRRQAAKREAVAVSAPESGM